MSENKLEKNIKGTLHFTHLSLHNVSLFLSDIIKKN